MSYTGCLAVFLVYEYLTSADTSPQRTNATPEYVPSNKHSVWGKMDRALQPRFAECCSEFLRAVTSMGNFVTSCAETIPVEYPLRLAVLHRSPWPPWPSI